MSLKEVKVYRDHSGDICYRNSRGVAMFSGSHISSLFLVQVAKEDEFIYRSVRDSDKLILTVRLKTDKLNDI